MADIVKGFRDAIQDLLVPELKAIRVEMGALKDGIKQNAQAIVELRKEMNDRFAKMDDRFAKVDDRFAKMDDRFEALQREMNERFAHVDERFATVMAELAEIRGQMKTTTKVLERILDRLDLADRVTKLEERVGFLMKKIPA